MPRTTNVNMEVQKNASANKPIHLFTLHLYDGVSDLRYCDSQADVTFDSLTYTRFPIAFDKISENNSGQIDAVAVTISNISRLIQSYLEDYDFRGKKVTITTVWADELDDPDAKIDDVFYVDAYQADQENVTFSLTSKFDVLDVELPLRRYNRNYCGWIFKGTECGYSGAGTTCAKTKTACKAYNNYQRFGGFPSVPGQRAIIV